MKRICLIFFLLISFSWGSVILAQDAQTVNNKINDNRPFNRIIGIGGLVGTPISLNLFLYNFEFNIAYLYLESHRMELSLDFFHPSFYLKFTEGFYMSVGMGIFIDFYFSPQRGAIDDIWVGTGLRIPFNFSYYIIKNEVELFIQPVMGVNFVPKVKFYGQIGLGVRYFFPIENKTKGA